MTADEGVARSLERLLRRPDVYLEMTDSGTAFNLYTCTFKRYIVGVEGKLDRLTHVIVFRKYGKSGSRKEKCEVSWRSVHSKGGYAEISDVSLFDNLLELYRRYEKSRIEKYL